MRNKHGFTLIEMVVVLAVIAVLAAILTPSITRYVENARVHRAENDCKIIAAAIAKFNSDMSAWPIWVSGSAMGHDGGAYKVLYSTGDAPTFVSGVVWDTADETLEDQLNANAVSYGTTWNGPYLPNLSADPWGNRYLVNVASLKPGEAKKAVFVLSAGPNEEVDTDDGQALVAGALSSDDIGCRIR